MGNPVSKMFLNFVSCSSKLINPKKGVVEIYDIQLVCQKHRWQPELVTGIWSGAVL